MALYPVASEQPTMRPTLANLAIIALNVFVFLLEILLGDTVIETWVFTPALAPWRSRSCSQRRPRTRSRACACAGRH
jgi:hypothetical protein